MGGGVVLCGGSVMAKNFVGGVMIIYKLARTAADPLPPLQTVAILHFCVVLA